MNKLNFFSDFNERRSNIFLSVIAWLKKNLCMVKKNLLVKINEQFESYHI